MKLHDALRFCFLFVAFGNGFKAGAQFTYLDTVYHLFGQKPETTYSSLKFSDNKFAIVGYGWDSTSSLVYTTNIFCIDALGDTLWSKKWVADSINDYVLGNYASFDKNQNIIIAGQYFNPQLQGEEGLLSKSDSAGNVKWLKLYGINHYGFWQGLYGQASLVTRNDNYILIAQVGIDSLNSDFLIIRTDTVGIELSRWEYGTPHYEAPFAGIQTNDNGFVFVGETSKDDSLAGTYDIFTIYIIKVDSNGDSLWAKSISEPIDQYGHPIDNAAGYSVIEDTDGYIICGNKPWKLNDSLYNLGIGPRAWQKMWVGKLSKDSGTLMWEKMYGLDTLDYAYFSNITVTADGNYALSGDYAWNNYQNNAACVYKIDHSGDLIWADSFNYAGNPHISVDPYEIHTIGTSGYMLTGYVLLNNNDDAFPWVVTIDSNGYSPPYVPDTITAIGIVNADSVRFKLYPNPSTGLFQLHMANPAGPTEIQVYNLLGEQVYQSAITQANTTLNLTTLAQGIYLYRISAETNPSPAAAGKLVIAR